MQALQQGLEAHCKVSGHPGIVNLKGVYTDHESVYVLTEFCQGGTLSTVLKGGKISESGIASIATQAASAISHCHELGVLHGNVNPDTVWFSGSTDKCVQVKLAGFDESQYVDNAHHRMARTTNQVQYRAREVFLKSYLPSVDAWALGAVLYEAVAGQAAYQGTYKEVAYKIMHRQLPDFESSPWQHADKNAVKLVSSLLASKHHYRLKLDKVAKHPWVMHLCGASNSGMQAAGAETSGDFALQQADNRCPASIGKQASTRSKSAPNSRELPSADKKSEAAAKGCKIRPQPGQGTQVQGPSTKERTSARSKSNGKEAPAGRSRSAGPPRSASAHKTRSVAAHGRRTGAATLAEDQVKGSSAAEELALAEQALFPEVVRRSKSTQEKNPNEHSQEPGAILKWMIKEADEKKADIEKQLTSTQTLFERKFGRGANIRQIQAQNQAIVAEQHAVGVSGMPLHEQPPRTLHCLVQERLPGLDEELAKTRNPEWGGYNPYTLSLEERRSLTAKVPELILDPLERRAAIAVVGRNNQIDLREELEKEQQRLKLTPAEQTAYGEAFMATPKDFKKIAERMGTRTTEECAMIWGDQKHSPWFQPYFKYKAGKCKCCDEVKARGLCRHNSQRAKVHGSAKSPRKNAQQQDKQEEEPSVPASAFMPSIIARNKAFERSSAQNAAMLSGDAAGSDAASEDQHHPTPHPQAHAQLPPSPAFLRILLALDVEMMQERAQGARKSILEGAVILAQHAKGKCLCQLQSYDFDGNMQATFTTQLGEKVHADCVLGSSQLEQYHLDLLQVMIVTGHHPRLLLDEVAHANMRARVEQSVEYFELEKQLRTPDMNGEQEQNLRNKLNALASKVAGRPCDKVYASINRDFNSQEQNIWRHKEVPYKIMHRQLPDFESSPWQHADKNAVQFVSSLLASKHH
ncbi:hypothetical protein WJX79_010855 [Trebouxia sp. C0005]